MTHFEDAGDGCESFEYNGWKVRIWPSRDHRIDVTPPGQQGAFGPYHRVEVDADGIWVSGMTPGHGYDSPSPFTIPWPVIEAIVEARATLGV